jgi:hypothetical protein
MGRFIKKKGYRARKRRDTIKAKTLCYNCNSPDHIMADCSYEDKRFYNGDLKLKKNKKDKKEKEKKAKKSFTFNKKKKGGGYVVIWDSDNSDSDDDASSSDDERTTRRAITIYKHRPLQQAIHLRHYIDMSYGQTYQGKI